MSPVSPIPNLPPVSMPVGIRPVGQDRKREPDPDLKDEDEDAADPDPDSTPVSESPAGSDSELNPDDRGQIIDVKA